MVTSLLFYYALFAITMIYGAVLVYLSRGFILLKKQTKTEDLPRISVVVCAHNEEKNLPDGIRLLAAQDYPEERIEFILVNDRSTDRTGELIARAAQNDRRFRYLTITDRSPEMAPKKRAIDAAIRMAKGDIILLTDADGRPGKHWARTMASYFTPDTHMVIGYAPYQVKPANHHIKRLLALEYLSHACVAAATTGLGFPVTCVGTNMAYRKSLYLEIGGFGEYKNFISGDDDLFLTRVREAKKYRIKYATDADSHVYNNPPQLWSKFLHQRVRYASKGLSYPLKVSAVLLVYYLYNLGLAAGAALSGFFPVFWPMFLFILGSKALAEFHFMRRGAETLHDTRHLIYFPVAFVLHPFYVILFGFLGQFKRFKWAEQTAESAVQKSVPEQAVQR